MSTSDFKEGGSSSSGKSTFRSILIAVISLTILFTSLIVTVMEIVVCNNVHSVLSGSDTAVGRHFLGLNLGDKHSISVTRYNKHSVGPILSKAIIGFKSVTDDLDTKVNAGEQFLFYSVKSEKSWNQFKKSKSEKDFEAAISKVMVLAKDNSKQPAKKTNP